jgi:hypothetical protein
MQGVTSLSFWLQSWEHECCGPERRVGETVEVTLSFDGDVTTTDAVALFESDRNGRSRIVGEIDRQVGSFTGYLVHAPDVHFAVTRGNPPGDRVQCSGRLWEERHGPTEWPSSTLNVGQIEEIWYCTTGDAGGPETSTRIYNTSKRPPRSGDWAFRFVVSIQKPEMDATPTLP